MSPAHSRRRALTSRTGQRALASAFLGRFFENEITAGSPDLRNSFFWLIAFLAAPGFLAPVAMIWGWNLVVNLYGPDALRLVSRADKVLYLGFGMAATGVVTAVVWNALLIDRRDALVLGPLPIDGTTIVRAKRRALLTYAGIVAAAMHALSSPAFGLMLATGRDVAFAVRGTIAHFVAAGLGSAFVLLAVVAVQSCLLAALGPRRFGRLSPVLQIGLVAAVMLSLLTLTTISLAVNDTLAGHGRRVLPWVLDTPPAWFLGVYEVILGTDDPGLHRLALKGLGALLAVGLSIWLAYPLAYRRVVATAIEDPGGPRRPGLTGVIARRLAGALTRRPAGRAAVQFLLATIGRGERHRFAVATALGLGVAFSVPVILQWRRTLDALPDEPPVPMLVLPVAATVFLLIGLRVAVALPSNLAASWIFDTAAAPANHIRTALWRLFVFVGVLPIPMLLTPVYARHWGTPLALTHTLLAVAAGAVVAEALLFRQAGMPCSRPWRLERARLRAFWPAYLLAFAVITQGVAAGSPRLVARPATLAAVVAALLLLRLVLRWAGAPPATEGSPEPDDAPPPLGVLNLE